MESRSLAARYVETMVATMKPDLDLFTDDAVHWHNFDEVELPLQGADPEQAPVARAAVPDLAGREVRIHSWDDGFAVQYVFGGTANDGTVIRIPVCSVATVRDGLISRIEDYADTAQAAALRQAIASVSR